MDPLHDDELNRALERWEVPEPPAHLERKTMEACRPAFRRPRRWRSLLTMQVHLPLPVVVAAVLSIAGLTVMLARMELRRPPEQPAAIGPAWGGLRPVVELRARIIRGQNADH